MYVGVFVCMYVCNELVEPMGQRVCVYVGVFVCMYVMN